MRETRTLRRAAAGAWIACALACASAGYAIETVSPAETVPPVGAPAPVETPPPIETSPPADTSPPITQEADVPDAGPDATGSTTTGATGSMADAPRVALARFTTAVENQEPVDTVSFLPNDAARVYFYTDLRGLQGSTVVHRWSYGGDVVAEIPFDVKGPRWRVWSSKRLRADWVGDWTASVVGPGDVVLAIETFTVQRVE